MQLTGHLIRNSAELILYQQIPQNGTSSQGNHNYWQSIKERLGNWIYLIIFLIVLAIFIIILYINKQCCSKNYSKTSNNSITLENLALPNSTKTDTIISRSWI